MSTPARIAVAVPLPLAEAAYDYAVPEGMGLQPGDFVRVPFGKREEVGVVWGPAQGEVAPEKVKPVAQRLEVAPMGAPLRRLIVWMATYTASPLGAVLKMAMPPREVWQPLKRNVSRIQSPESIDEHGTPVHLSKTQAEVARMLREQVQQNRFAVSVLDGVTGSGKTEVYFEAIAEALDAASSQILVLLPEIALSVQWLARFKRRFGFAPAVWHSDVTKARKRETWKGVASGEVRLVVGARSALFLPFQNLRLLIADEEHEPAYKQEDGVCYHARDMAVARARHEQAAAVLVSATPSLETLANSEAGKYTRLALPSRHGSATLPTVRTLDMRGGACERGAFISLELRRMLAGTLADGQQAMVFLNRRGYAPLTLCRACGHRLTCPNCSAWLVYHRRTGRLHCHHCGYGQRLDPPECPECGAEESLVPCGPGVERVAEEVSAFLPQARTALMTSDHVATPKAAEAMVGAMERGEIDILIGTQMMAKGYHFPGLTLVGVVDADLGLAGGDLRASERTWQLLHQVAGRAGRAEHPGTVLLQTYMPEHPVMQTMVAHDRDRFIALEMGYRRDARMPPFTRLAAVLITGKDETKVRDVAQALAACAPHVPEVDVLGPAPAAMTYLRRQYRYRLLVRAPKELNVQKLLRDWLARVSPVSSVRVKVDVDPYSFV